MPYETHNTLSARVTAYHGTNTDFLVSNYRELSGYTSFKLSTLLYKSTHKLLVLKYLHKRAPCLESVLQLAVKESR